MVRALDFCLGDQGSNPARVVKLSTVLFSFVTAFKSEDMTTDVNKIIIKALQAVPRHVLIFVVAHVLE